MVKKISNFNELQRKTEEKETPTTTTIIPELFKNTY